MLRMPSVSNRARCATDHALHQKEKVGGAANTQAAMDVAQVRANGAGTKLQLLGGGRDVGVSPQREYDTNLGGTEPKRLAQDALGQGAGLLRLQFGDEAQDASVTPHATECARR